VKEKRTERIEFRIEPSLKDLLENMAYDNECNVSDFVRTIILKEAKKYRRTQQKTLILRSEK
jgi:uncharacterized protein (DUF1778 family)